MVLPPKHTARVDGVTARPVAGLLTFTGTVVVADVHGVSVVKFTV